MNIREKISELGINITIGIFFLGLMIFIISISGEGSTQNMYLILTGILIMVPFIVYFLFHFLKSKKLDRKARLEFENFKRTANQIKVNLENLEIRSNSWTDSIVINNTEYGGYNQLAGYGEKNIKKVKRNINYIEIKIPYEGKTIDYNVNISMDTTKLKIHFAIQKETILYVDPKNSERNYLDLEFLS